MEKVGMRVAVFLTEGLWLWGASFLSEDGPLLCGLATGWWFTGWTLRRGLFSAPPCSFLCPSPADPWCSPWTGAILRCRSKPSPAWGTGQAGDSSWVGYGPQVQAERRGPAQPPAFFLTLHSPVRGRGCSWCLCTDEETEVQGCCPTPWQSPDLWPPARPSCLVSGVGLRFTVSWPGSTARVGGG